MELITLAQIEWKRRAVKQLLKLDKKTQPVITEAVGKLEDYRSAKNVKLLNNHQYDYRLRIGNYRVLFDVVNDVVEIVLIQEVKKRDENTY
jgi:mRNA-degrading endonuclease RelE of RelBE toxin-antitoxin system